MVELSIPKKSYVFCFSILTSFGSPFGILCLYVILTISYLRAQTIETSSLPTDSSQPLFKQIEIFSSILTVCFNCKYFPQYTRELLECPFGISPSGRSTRGGKNAFKRFICRQELLYVVVACVAGVKGEGEGKKEKKEVGKKREGIEERGKGTPATITPSCSPSRTLASANSDWIIRQ